MLLCAPHSHTPALTSVVGLSRSATRWPGLESLTKEATNWHRRRGNVRAFEKCRTLRTIGLERTK